VIPIVWISTRGGAHGQALSRTLQFRREIQIAAQARHVLGMHGRILDEQRGVSGEPA
jgi:hypothetical protein